jgi:glycine/D-amino acid oxidase-like deaminating enzyme
LFIATAGTWHGWKFLPTVGEFVVQMLYGELPEVMAARWAWDRDLENIPANDALPQRELRDIEI